MLNNKKFARYSVIFCILGVIMMFFYSGLQNDHLNILSPYLQKTYGWSATKATNPSTWGSIFVIVFYLITGAAFVKFGVRRFMVPTTLVLGIGCILIAVSGGNYTLYTMGLFLVRVLVVPLQMGGFMLAANWFIKTRGRVMGIITAGAPLFSVVGISVLTYTVTIAGGIKPAYIIIGVVLMVFAILVGVLLKDNPEDVGLYPDGVEHPTADVHEEETMTLKQVLSESRAWKLIVSFGILQFVINAMMSSMALRYFSLSDNPENPAATWMKALVFLSIGAICGIPMSFVLGWIDDKWGSIKASLILTVMFFFAVIPMWFMPVGGSVPLMLCWAFGVACMTGGVPTMHPCITAYVYGRKKYQSANKWIMMIQAIPFAFSVLYMTAMFDAGLVFEAYAGLIVMLVVAFIVLITMLKIPDANAVDRDYKKKKVSVAFKENTVV